MDRVVVKGAPKATSRIWVDVAIVIFTQGTESVELLLNTVTLSVYQNIISEAEYSTWPLLLVGCDTYVR